MIEVEERLSYADVIDLMRYDAREIIPIENPTPEQLDKLESVIGKAECIFSPWPEDFGGRALVGCFLFSREDQPEWSPLRNAFAVCTMLDIPLFAIIGLSTELLDLPSEEFQVLVTLHEFCHLLEPWHNDDFEELFGRQLFAFFAKKSGGIVSFGSE